MKTNHAIRAASKRALGQLFAACAASALALTPALAEETVFDVGLYGVDGIMIYCGDIYTIVRTEETELIYALDYENIVINGPVYDTLSPGIRLFAYYQTCGQMFYGDMALADMSATRRGARDRWLTVDDVETMCETDTLAEAGWTTAPDAERCEAIYQTMRELLL